MPIVTATPKGQLNGEVVTEFTDVTSTTSVTYTYPVQQSAILIENSGVSDIFVTVGAYLNRVVKPNKKWRADVVFTTFSIRSDMNSQEFVATTFQNDIGGSNVADHITRDLVNRGRYTVDMISEPFVIAHRGGANVFPENTMEAFRYIVASGVRIIEPDVQTLCDGTLAVMHDDTVDAVTSSTGPLADHTAYTYKKLTVDASAWLAPGYVDTKPVLFEELLREFGNSVVYVPESKDIKSTQKIVDALKKYGLERNAIIQSYSLTDIAPAVAAGIETLFLTSTSGDPQSIVNAGVRYVGCSVNSTDTYVQSLVSAGLKTVVWTIDFRTTWDQWKAKGVVGCFSNDPLWISGANSHKRTKDPFSQKVFFHGHLTTGATRGTFSGTNALTFTGTTNDWVLQGWGCPLTQTSYTVNATMIFDTITDTAKFAAIAVCSPIDFFRHHHSLLSQGYHILMNANGTLQINRVVNGANTMISSVTTAAIVAGESVTLKVDVTPTTITVTRVGAIAPNFCTANDTTHRGGYFFIGRETNVITFSNVTVT